jgi:phage FluMu protein Com
MISTKLNCKKCNRYLGQALGSAKINELICAKCKHRNSFDIRVKEKSNGQKTSAC